MDSIDAHLYLDQGIELPPGNRLEQLRDAIVVAALQYADARLPQYADIRLRTAVSNYRRELDRQGRKS